MGDVPGSSTAPYFNPRKATENFSRLCQLIMTICSDLFRDILSRYIKPADLRLELDNNITKLEKIMNAQQKEHIYPPSGTTTLTSKDLDISVLYILLRNICKIPKHQNGWGNPPLDTDTRLAACIERIRIQRNLISAHSTIGEIEDSVFQDHWNKLKNSILEIEKQLIGGDMYQRGIDELLSCDLNPTRAEKYMKEFKHIQEQMERFESTMKTAQRRVAVKRARLDKQQASTTSQIKDLQTTLLTSLEARLDEQQASTTSQIKDTFKDLETTLLTNIQARFAALEEKQQGANPFGRPGREMPKIPGIASPQEWSHLQISSPLFSGSHWSKPDERERELEKEKGKEKEREVLLGLARSSEDRERERRPSDRERRGSVDLDQSKDRPFHGGDVRHPHTISHSRSRSRSPLVGSRLDSARSEVVHSLIRRSMLREYRRKSLIDFRFESLEMALERARMLNSLQPPSVGLERIPPSSSLWGPQEKNSIYLRNYENLQIQREMEQEQERMPNPLQPPNVGLERVPKDEILL
ncbi:uncharacterized protein LOC130048043 isoform X2 [Ostrea edulis]|uniref:uncharacterized protein LOC130048043 isoform X2 n=1 Tax=Ostrea edulis TaxID=37623 RepID=UPI0024AFA10D|nr:uncharacterized protein LOC130048043 isoform X2 [Ostrea edulis]XP_056000028.1 uncharacterized protein LOC130048043 isoform X2 [Ostrea edulis]